MAYCVHTVTEIPGKGAGNADAMLNAATMLNAAATMLNACRCLPAPAPVPVLAIIVLVTLAAPTTLPPARSHTGSEVGMTRKQPVACDPGRERTGRRAGGGASAGGGAGGGGGMSRLIGDLLRLVPVGMRAPALEARVAAAGQPHREGQAGQGAQGQEREQDGEGEGGEEDGSRGRGSSGSGSSSDWESADEEVRAWRVGRVVEWDGGGGEACGGVGGGGGAGDWGGPKAGTVGCSVGAVAVVVCV